MDYNKFNSEFKLNFHPNVVKNVSDDLMANILEKSEKHEKCADCDGEESCKTKKKGVPVEVNPSIEVDKDK